MASTARRADRLTTAGVLLLLGAGGWLALGWVMHPDVAFYTTAAQQLAAGDQLYGDVGDMNAPAIYWLHLLLLWLARIAGVGEQATLVLVFCVAAAALLLWVGALLRPFAPAAARALPLLLAAALTFAALGIFGEREHWATLLLLPHLAATAALAGGAAPPRGQALGAAALAGAAVLLKPPYLALLLTLPELWLAWQRRRWSSLWRGPLLLAGAACLATAALMLLIHPAYLQRVLPEALEYYAALGKPLVELLRPRGIWLPLLLLLWALLLAPRAGALGKAAGVFLWAAMGGVGAFLLQAKGFAYHWLPVLVLALAGVTLLLAESGGRQRILLLPLLLLPLWIGYLGWQQARGGPAAWSEARTLAAALRPGERVFALNPELYPLFPALTLAGAWWLGPDSHLWQLDGLYRAHPAPGEPGAFRPPIRQAAAEAAQRERLVRRFLEGRPDLVAVYVGHGTPTVGGSAFGYLDYFLADPAFAAGWQDYRLDMRIGDYDLYRRRAP